MTPHRERLIETVLREDPLAKLLWPVYASELSGAGIDPNCPPPGIMPFEEFILQGLHGEAGAQWLSLNSDLDEQARTERKLRRDAVRANVEALWGLPLSLLERVIILADRIAGTWRARLNPYSEGELVTEHTILGLLLRSIQVAEETLTLLDEGMAAGAEARWRTLHEMAVIGAFLARDEGDDTAIRYLEHHYVKSYQRMQDEQAHHEMLGFPPYTAEEMKESKALHDGAIAKYGTHFNTDYGWAFAAVKAAAPERLQPAKKGKSRGGSPRAPRFMDLEALVNLGHFKVAFGSSSTQIHGGATALFQHPAGDALGVPAYLARTTPLGLREPTVRAVAALHILSSALVLRAGAPEEMLMLASLQSLSAECAKALMKAEEASERPGAL